MTDYTCINTLLLKIAVKDSLEVFYCWKPLARKMKLLKDFIDKSETYNIIHLDIDSKSLTHILDYLSNSYDSIHKLAGMQDCIDFIRAYDYLQGNVNDFAKISDLIFDKQWHVESEHLHWHSFYKWAKEHDKDLYKFKDAIDVLQHFQKKNNT